MTKLKLTVNEQKTRICRVPEESFDFLGYTLGRCYSPKTGRCLHRHPALTQADQRHLRAKSAG
ncbi:MAG: hypothetical protein V9H26_12830 [Verrucomicrobiota bacterium]